MDITSKLSKATKGNLAPRPKAGLIATLAKSLNGSLQLSFQCGNDFTKPVDLYSIDATGTFLPGQDISIDLPEEENVLGLSLYLPPGQNHIIAILELSESLEHNYFEGIIWHEKNANDDESFSLGWVQPTEDSSSSNYAKLRVNTTTSLRLGAAVRR